jgi:hypothetical protein
MSKAILTALLLLSGMLQQIPPAFPREGAIQIIDNNRVAVWDVTWPKGKPTLMQQGKFDMVTIELEDAAIKVTSAKSKTKTVPLKLGQASFMERGVTQKEEGTSDPMRHAIVIELKDVIVAPLEYDKVFPDAFPRDGAKKLLSNKRVTVWDYTWTMNVPTPIHFHAKDVVVVYLETGEVKSEAIDGSVVVNKLERGLTRFNARNRTHSEELIKGASRAIIVELHEQKPRSKRTFPIETVEH